MFLCKVGSNLLATRKKILTKKEKVENPLCPIYLSKEEKTMHVVWKCPAANDVLAEPTNDVQKWIIFDLQCTNNLLMFWVKLMRNSTDENWNGWLLQ